MNSITLTKLIYSLLSTHSAYTFLILKLKKLPHCIIKYIMTEHLLPNYDIIYRDIFSLPIANIDKFIVTSAITRKSTLKIAKSLDNFRTDLRYYRFSMPSTLFSRKYILNFSIIKPLKKNCSKHDQILKLKMPHIPLYLQKAFNALCETEGIGKIQDLVYYYFKINQYKCKIAKYEQKLCELK